MKNNYKDVAHLKLPNGYFFEKKSLYRVAFFEDGNKGYLTDKNDILKKDIEVFFVKETQQSWVDKLIKEHEEKYDKKD